MTIGLDPADVKRLGNAFCHAKLLLTASEIGLFADLAAHGPSGERELGERLGLHPRGRRDFLYALVALGLLTKDGDRYANTPVAAANLVPGTPTYMGGFLNRANRMLYPAWGNLTEALRTGAPQVPAAHRQMLDDPAQRDNYLRMMDSVNSLVAPLLAAAYDFGPHTVLLDVGGARGNLAAKLTQAHPHLRPHIFDLPEMAEPTAAHAAATGVPVTFHGGDFFLDPLPEGDVLVLGHVLHNWAAEERALLVKKAYDAVTPGGALLVYDAMLDDEPTDLARILVSINMLLVTEGGAEYPASDCERWLRDAGFTSVTRTPLGSTDTLVAGHKPA